MGPIDYRLNLPDPTQSVMQAAQGIGQIAATQKQAQWSVEDRAQAQQQAELQRQAALAQQEALFKLSQDPTPENITRTMIRYPGLAKELQLAHQGATEEQTNAVYSNLGPVAAALNNGKTDVAKAILQQAKSGMENRQDARGAAAVGAILGMVDQNPNAASAMVNARLYAADPKRYETSMMTPEQVAKLRAEVQKTGAETKKTAEETLYVAPLAKAEAGLKGAQAGKASAEAGKAREETVTERVLRPGQVAKLDAQAAKERAEVEKLTGAGGNSQELATRVTSLVDDLLAPSATDALNDITGPVKGTRPVWTMNQAGADLNAKLSTIKSDAFLSQVAMMKGTGSLTDAEGAKLESAIASLDRSQSVAQLRQGLIEIKKTMTAAAKRAAERGAAPAAGNAASIMSAADAILAGAK